MKYKFKEKIKIFSKRGNKIGMRIKFTLIMEQIFIFNSMIVANLFSNCSPDHGQISFQKKNKRLFKTDLMFEYQINLQFYQSNTINCLFEYSMYELS